MPFIIFGKYAPHVLNIQNNYAPLVPKFNYTVYAKGLNITKYLLRCTIIVTLAANLCGKCAGKGPIILVKYVNSYISLNIQVTFVPCSRSLHRIHALKGDRLPRIRHVSQCTKCSSENENVDAISY